MNSLIQKEHQRAIKASELFYSQETAMLHMSYHERPFKRSDTLPLYHNFLYALALLQNKEKETMQKGMQLINHLLCFQIKEGAEKGAFPRYLHEYPYVERRFEVVDILLPLLWIYLDFSIVFPKEMRIRLLDAIKQAFCFLLEISNEKEPSYLLNIQLSSLSMAIGEIFKEEEWIDKGQKKLKQLFSKGADKSWGSFRHISKMLIYLELVSLKDAPYIQSFYHFVRRTWHPSTKSYLGPGINEHLYHNRQEPTLYHDLLSKELHQKPYPLLEADVLESILLKKKHFDESFIKKECLKYTLGPFEVQDCHLDEIGYSYFNLPQEIWEKRGGFYPFKLLIENKNEDPHSFALHMGTFVQIETLSSQSLLLTFENSSDKELDISFFTNISSKVQITQNKRKATLFDLSMPIEFDYGTYQILLKFPNQEKGIWAQLCRSNRRSQIIKEFNKTFDIELYFCRVENEIQKPLQIEIQIIKNEN